MALAICCRCARVHPWTSEAGGKLDALRCMTCDGHLEAVRRARCSRCGRDSGFGPQQARDPARRFDRAGGVGLRLYPGARRPWLPGDGEQAPLMPEPPRERAPVVKELDPTTPGPAELVSPHVKRSRARLTLPHEPERQGRGLLAPALPAPPSFPNAPDVPAAWIPVALLGAVPLLLASTPNENTRTAHKTSLNGFADFCGLPDAVIAGARLLALPEADAAVLARYFQSTMLLQGHAPNSVRLKMSSLRSLWATATRAGLVTGRLHVDVEPTRDRVSRHERRRRRNALRPVVAALPPAPLGPPTVADVLDLVLAVIAQRYGPSSEYRRAVYCTKLLRTMHGETPVSEFGPVKLRVVQAAMVTGWKDGEREHPGLSRKEINRRIKLMKRCFKIGVSYEVVPAAVFGALATLEPLRAGKTSAYEIAPIRPVPEKLWRATLEHVSPTIKAMILVQAATGARSGELCAMRVSDIDMTRNTWVYKPRSHKNAWRGETRVVPLGPCAREALVPMLEGLGPDDFIFSPTREEQQRRAEQRARRKSAVQPSQRDRRVADPERLPGAHYQVTSYARAIARACDAGGLAHWRPYRLRHGFIQKVRDAVGIEGAQCLAGHKSIEATQIYSQPSLERACELAERIG